MTYSNTTVYGLKWVWWIRSLVFSLPFEAVTALLMSIPALVGPAYYTIDYVVDVIMDLVVLWNILSKKSSE